MLHRRTQIIVRLLLAIIAVVRCIEHDSECRPGDDCVDSVHTVIRLTKRDDAMAARIAAEHGMRVRGRPFLDSHYFLEHIEEANIRHKRSTVERLSNHPQVEWVEEQRPRPRTKRDYLHLDNGEQEENGQSYSHSHSHGRSKRQLSRPSGGRPVPHLPFRDPLYADQWYLVGGAVGGFDMNVREAWNLGYAGRNVSVSILDDGIQRDHADLALNYDPLASTDINDHDDDPTPQNNGDNKHGTRCAGEVAAVAGNDQCGVGVAFYARIGGVRMLDGPVSDSVEAAALSLNQDHIDIYSASWGPEDDGKTFDGPGPLAREAFYRGIKQGRQGRGNIFVWASGNGGARQDSCSADGYTTSVYTLSISSATFDNHRPWYLEECPSSIATTYSSANINQPAIVTVDVPNGCTKMHTGTSASAPLAAGIIALALEANPQLTWRDMQHVVLRTANPTPLMNNPGWSLNGVGRRISNKFGYGLMDAGALVKLAEKWTTAPEQHICTYEYRLAEPNPRPLMGQFTTNFSLEVSGCETGTPVLYLEHVQVLATVRYGKRGDLKLTLYSPRGTRSVLLPPRPQDYNTNGFHKWPFLSVQMWGEDPRGTWILQIESVTTNRNVGGTFHDWSLLLYGTAEPAQPTDPRHDSDPPSATSLLGRATAHVTSQSEPTSGTISFGDLRSAGNCHIECIGCTESQSAVACISCKHFSQQLRNRAGFKCVKRCDDGFFLDEADRACRACSVHCHSCVKAEQCTTCPGSQLLIDVDHYGHFDHGQCVEKCPSGLIADYDTNVIQARCVLRKNPCAQGYFQSESNSACTQCNSACSECHGAGVMQCDICAPRYSNRTVGFCRPCCSNTQKSVEDHCEDCSSSSLLFGESPALPVPTLIILLCVFMIVMAGVIFCVSVCRDAQEGSGSYTPLPLYGDVESSSKAQSTRRTIQMDSEDSDSESELFNNADNVRIVGRS